MDSINDIVCGVTRVTVKPSYVKDLPGVAPFTEYVVDDIDEVDEDEYYLMLNGYWIPLYTCDLAAPPYQALDTGVI